MTVTEIEDSLIFAELSLILSKITTVSYKEYPNTVSTAIIVAGVTSIPVSIYMHTHINKS